MRKGEVLQNRYQQIWQSRAFVVVLFVVLFFMLSSVTKEFARRYETRHDIAKLEADVARLSKRNSQMHDLIALLNTSTAQDKEARVKLGLQAPGEQIVIVSNAPVHGEIVLPDSDTIEYIPVQTTSPSPKRWFEYFKQKFYHSQTL